MSARLSIVCTLALAAGCLDAERPGDAPDTQTGSQAIGGGCDEFMCGTNSPQVGSFGFWDLQMPSSLATPGAPNNVGMRLQGFVKNGAAYLVAVRAGRLQALSPVSPYPVAYAGAGLVGGSLYLVNGVRHFQIRISEVGSVTSWAQPLVGGPVTLESYKLDWTELVNGQWGDFRNVCTNPPSRENPDALTMTGAAQYHTLLFEGDRILASTKQVYAVDNSWFNLGCAGSALAKLALGGHTQAAYRAGTFHTSLPQRQAMLKMLAADYCGDGTPYTVGGQWLNWKDDAGTMKLLADAQGKPSILEARWGADGPTCLAKPRVDVHPTTAAAAYFFPAANSLSVYDQAFAHCPNKLPPVCVDGDYSVMDGAHLLSATPI